MTQTFDSRPRDQEHVGQKSLGRRTFLRRTGGAAAVVAGTVAMQAIVRGAPQIIQFWTTQRATEQTQAYHEILARFKTEYPDYEVNLQASPAEKVWEKLTAGYAAGEVPDLISHLPAPPIVQLNDEGLVEPFDEVINAVGKDDFIPSMIDIYRDKDRGYYMAATVVNQVTNNMWYRKDLLAEAGLNPPVYWDDLLKAAKAMTKGDIYGTCFPAGKTDMGSIMLKTSVWQSGGYVVDPDLNVTFNSPEVVAALEYIKEIFPYSPAGSASYSYAEPINAFVTGRVATSPYTGLVLQNVSTQNPKIEDHISVRAWPYRRGGGQIGHRSGFTNLFIPKGGKNLKGAKLLAQWLFRRDSYVRFLHSAPGHNLPVLKSVANSKEFLAHPLLVKYRNELDVMLENLAGARSLLMESSKHKFNKKAGVLFSSKTLAEILQDLVVGGMSPKEVAARGADKIAKIMKG